MKSKTITTFLISIFFLCIMSGCMGKKTQSLKLEEQICTPELLNYQLEDGTTINSSVKSFEILSSRTTDDHDSSNIKVVLEDDLLERNLFITAESTKYEQGWLIDSINVTDSSFTLIGEIDQNYILSYLSEDRTDNYGQGNFTNYRTIEGVASGLHNLTQTSTTIQDNSFFAVFEINDSHQYADISGPVYVRVDLTMDSTSTGSCSVRRTISVDTDAVSTNWHDIYGTYLLSMPYASSNLQQYVTIDENKNVFGYREYIAAFTNQLCHEDLTGTFNAVNYSTAIVQVVNGFDYSEYIIFTPDEINYKYLYPNGDNYDTGLGDYSTVIYEKLN